MQLLPACLTSKKNDNEFVWVVMTKSICLDSHNLSLCIRINRNSFCLPDLTKTLKEKKKKKGATSFYFKIKIGYIITFFCVLFSTMTLKDTHYISLIFAHIKVLSYYFTDKNIFYTSHFYIRYGGIYSGTSGEVGYLTYEAYSNFILYISHYI